MLLENWILKSFSVGIFLKGWMLPWAGYTCLKSSVQGGLSSAAVIRDFLASIERWFGVGGPALPLSAEINPVLGCRPPGAAQGRAGTMGVGNVLVLHRVMLGLHQGLKEPLMGWK